jgi:hypothetical protein
MSEELRELFEADQADRFGDRMPADVTERDRARRRRVAELLEAEEAQTADDFFHAAMVFQHGVVVEDYWRAHELALRSAELGHRSGRWLAEAAYDRWLLRQGRRQRYGTYHTTRGGPWWELYEVEPEATDK